MSDNDKGHLKDKQVIGQKGEDLTFKFLVKHGFCVLDRNYRKKLGEIDLIVEKDAIIHFVEVKTVSRETLQIVTRQTLDEYEPEDNVHPWKRKRLARAIQTWLLEHKKYEYFDWQCDVASVYVSRETNDHKIEWLYDIILS